VFGLAVSMNGKEFVDSCSIPRGSINCRTEKVQEINFLFFCIIRIILIIRIIIQVRALLRTLEFQESAKRKDHFALFNCLVLGHTNSNGVQRVNCNPFPAKPFHGSHRFDMVIIRLPGIDNGGFVVSTVTVWYAQVLLLFSASAMTDIGSKTFECALVSTMTILKMVIISIKYIITIISVEHNIVFQAGWNLSVPEYYPSSTKRNQFSKSSHLRVSWGNCQ
jgi:hypothetical protein